MRKKELYSYLDKLKNDFGDFKFSLDNPVSNLYSNCFAVMTLDLINKLNDLPTDEKNMLITFIQNYQDEKTGYFIDNTIFYSSKHDEEYVLLQLTDFAQLALSVFNKKPKHAYEFLTKYKNEEYLEEWFYSLNWKNPWRVSNLIMFILNCLIYEDEDNNKIYINHIIRLLNKTQNPKNGYWNLGNKVSYHNQMAGAYHFIFFYTYLGIRPNYTKEIIDSTLAIQNYDGLFNYGGGGGSCDDLDAIDLLCRGMFYTNYREKDIQEALKNTYKSILKNQNSDGGFCWAKIVVRPSFLLNSLLDFKLLNYSMLDYMKNIKSKFLFFLLQFFPGLLIWRYSGTKTMQLKFNQSDIFSTWFRLTALALIEETFPEVCNYEKSFDWNLRTKCGLGYYKK